MSTTPSLTRAVRRAFGLGLPPGGLVLLYHRIARLASDPQCLAVLPEHFAGHLDVIATHAVPMTLAAMLQQAQEGVLPPGAVAVTFDDGYADNLETAAPMLAAAGVPATVFVSTGAVQQSREFWWDEIERIVLGPGCLPARLCVAIGTGHAEWNLTGALERTLDDCSRDAGWTVLKDGYPTARHRAYAELCLRLRPLDAPARERVLDELAAIAGQPRVVRATHRPLSAAQVAALGRDQVAALGRDHVDIGSHTESHPSLAALPPDEQYAEIHRARRQLERVVAAPVTSLAYPFGGRDDVSRATVAAARRAGVTIACSTVPGVVDAATDALSVPRLLVRDWTRAQFATRWAQWTGGVASGVAP